VGISSTTDLGCWTWIGIREKLGALVLEGMERVDCGCRGLRQLNNEVPGYNALHTMYCGGQFLPSPIHFPQTCGCTALGTNTTANKSGSNELNGKVHEVCQADRSREFSRTAWRWAGLEDFENSASTWMIVMGGGHMNTSISRSKQTPGFCDEK